MIYLDNSATTFPKPEEVYKALDFANRNLAFNSGRGNYKKAQEVTKIIDETREEIASLVNADANNVAFLSSATECLNVVINGLQLDDGDVVYISPFEHNAIVRPLFEIQKEKKIEIILIPFDKKTWHPDLKKLDEMMAIKKPKAVFVSQISNVTGLMLDYENIFELAKKYQGLTVLDSAQAFGVVNPNLKNVDFCVFAGHKSLYSSFGIAGIIAKDFSLLNVTKSGGTGSDSLNHYMPEKGYGRVEAGSPNIVAIYGLHESIKWLKNNDVFKHERTLTSLLINRLRDIEDIVIYMPEKDDDLLGIVSINIEGYSPADIGSILSNEFDIAVRTGYHCSPFVHEFIGSNKFNGTVRISLGAFNTENDIDKLIEALNTL